MKLYIILYKWIKGLLFSRYALKGRSDYDSLVLTEVIADDGECIQQEHGISRSPRWPLNPGTP